MNANQWNLQDYAVDDVCNDVWHSLYFMFYINDVLPHTWDCLHILFKLFNINVIGLRTSTLTLIFFSL